MLRTMKSLGRHGSTKLILSVPIHFNVRTCKIRTPTGNNLHDILGSAAPRPDVRVLWERWKVSTHISS